MIDTIITGVVALVSALLGSSVLYFRQNKRSKDLDNELKLASAWENFSHEMESKCTEKDTKIDELRKHINILQGDKLKLVESKQKEVQELQGELFAEKIKAVELNYNKCVVVGCNKRIPPRKEEQKTNNSKTE